MPWWRWTWAAPWGRDAPGVDREGGVGRGDGQFPGESLGQETLERGGIGGDRWFGVRGGVKSRDEIVGALSGGEGLVVGGCEPEDLKTGGARR